MGISSLRMFVMAERPGKGGREQTNLIEILKNVNQNLWARQLRVSAAWPG
jgi:hypothetical protein